MPGRVDGDERMRIDREKGVHRRTREKRHRERERKGFLKRNPRSL